LKKRNFVIILTLLLLPLVVCSNPCFLEIWKKLHRVEIDNPKLDELLNKEFSSYNSANEMLDDINVMEKIVRDEIAKWDNDKVIQEVQLWINVHNNKIDGIVGLGHIPGSGQNNNFETVREIEREYVKLVREGIRGKEGQSLLVQAYNNTENYLDTALQLIEVYGDKKLDKSYKYLKMWRENIAQSALIREFYNRVASGKITFN